MAHHDPSPEIVDSRRLPRAATGAVLVLAFALSALLFGSAAKAALFALALAVFSAPGVPLARRWFRGPFGILAGAVLGYLASSILASVLVRFELLGPGTMVGASIALYFAARAFSPFVPERSRGEADAIGGFFAAALLIPLLLVAWPFLEVGSRVSDGVAFRAYFSADLMTHLSVVAELQKGAYPPANPFYAGEPLHYYWLFFGGPAAFGESGTNQAALLTLYLASGMLFAGLLFGAVRDLGLAPSRAFLATGVGLLAVSYEGLLTLLRSALGEGSFRDTNVDAFGRWVLGLVSLDGLHRSVLYTPQHLFSYSLLLVLLVLVHRGEPRNRSGSVLLGALLGGMAGTSIVTAMLAGPWTVGVTFFRRDRQDPQGSFRRVLALSLWTAAPALLLLAGFMALGFFGGASGSLTLRVPKWPELFSVLALDCGALSLLCLYRIPSGFRRFDRELAALALLSLLAVLFLDLEGYEGVWMAWRAGSVLLVCLGLLAAPALGGALRGRHALAVAPALLTAVLDVVNAQDVSNRSLSPGEFRWTTVVSRDEWEALQWIRAETPPDSVVQWDVRARELGEWALLPAIAERRMAVGSPIFLLDLHKYRVRERREVRPIFTSGDPFEAHRLATGLGIDYLFLGSRELRARGERLRRLFESRALFRPVFENPGVTILAVVPR
ncbi:MAG TPA: hypothetical protein VIE88_13685 [Vicinamibacteria bacterium]